MKKIFIKSKIALVLVLMLIVVSCFTFTACGGGDTDGNGGSNVVMTESYQKARTEFKAVTGVMLPAMEKLEVEDYPYTEGDDSYCFDITGGENLNYQTYLDFKSYLDSALSTWTATGPSVSGEYTNIDYNSASGWIGLTWDGTNNAIYINALMN